MEEESVGERFRRNRRTGLVRLGSIRWTESLSTDETTQHNPEFTMLEFYWAYVDYQRLMAFTEELLTTVARQVIGTTELPFGEHTINMSAPFKRLSLRHAAAEAASARLGVAVTVEELRDVAAPLRSRGSSASRSRRAAAPARWPVRSSSRSGKEI